MKALEKKGLERKYADKDQNTEYYDGYDSALKVVLKKLIDMK